MAAGVDITLLQFVQRLMSAFSLDGISTLGETEDANMVLDIVNRMFERVIAEYPWAHYRGITALNATTTSHIMQIPAAVGLFDWIKYDNNVVNFKSPAFMDDLLRSRDTAQSNIDSNGAFNDRNPSYWTTNDDLNIIFDAYPTSFTPSKFQVRTVVYPTAELLSDTDQLGLPLTLRILLEDMCLEKIAKEIIGDEGAEDRLRRDVRRSRMHAKRWAQKHNRVKSFYHPGYGRQRGITFQDRSRIDVDRITEGS